MTLSSVNAATLKQWLDRGEAMLIDVREPAEYQAEHIAGAVLMPMAQVTHSALPAAPGKKLVVHCRKGARGESVCAKLLAAGTDREMYNLEGGIAAWDAAGYPVVRSGKKHLPLDRQVQLTIGIGVLLGSLLGYFVSPGFFALSGFFGAGLTFAGLTGFCGLAMLLARAPWNQQQTA